MAFDDETEDDRPSSAPLPPDDRLWRHPSELAATAPDAPVRSLDGGAAAGRTLAVAALASACLAGAVVAVGAMWFTRPTRVVVREATPVAASAATAARFAPAPGAEALAAQIAPSLAAVHVQRAGSWTTTTGIWLDADGAVVATAPAVDGAEALVVVGDDGVRQSATLVGTDVATGIAVLDVATTAGVALSRSTTLGRTGAAVSVIGAAMPARGDQQAPRFVSAAISAIGVRTDVGSLVLHDAVQLDRALPDDALGGAVVDQAGTVVAIVLSTRSDAELAIAVPAAVALERARTLRERGEVRRAWLGVQAVDLDPGLAQSMDLRGGALLTAVVADSPAASCGLEQGDVVTMVDGDPVDDASDLVLALRDRAPDDAVEIRWVRGDTEMAAPVTLGDAAGG